ncbi:MAG: hypothetical protein ACOX1L_04630 [Erysipelotrichaceae bacterium]|jgi:hypothetical protein
MARKKVMFEINDEEKTLEQPAIEDEERSFEEVISDEVSSTDKDDTKFFEVESEDSLEESFLENEEPASEEAISADEGDTKIFEVESDIDLEQPEEVLETASSMEEEILEQPTINDDELFLGLTSAAEEGDTKIFEKVEDDQELEQSEAIVEANTEETKENKMKKKPAGQPRKIRRKKKEKLGFNWFFWISLIVISIPVVYFISLLVEASKVSHLPILGDRIKNTVVYTINESDINYISTTVKQLEGVEDAEVNLIVETLRITVDVNNDYTEEQIQELILSIYTIVDEKIPIATYFTRDGDYKQYDLDIMAFTDINSEEIIIINLIKNGSMEEYSVQVLSRPINPELVDRLKEEQNPEKEEVQPEQEGEFDAEAE